MMEGIAYMQWHLVFSRQLATIRVQWKNLTYGRFLQLHLPISAGALTDIPKAALNHVLFFDAVFTRWCIMLSTLVEV